MRFFPAFFQKVSVFQKSWINNKLVKSAIYALSLEGGRGEEGGWAGVGDSFCNKLPTP